jgi:rubrerythrin
MAAEPADEILDYAIEREQEAHDYYMDLASRSQRPGMKQTFTQFAGEELGHKKRLEGIKQGKLMVAASPRRIQDLKIAEYVVDVDDSGGELSMQDALILAMKREKASFRLYSDLADAIDDPNLKSTFLMLAQEEAKHKLRFEVEYDEVILADN